MHSVDVRRLAAVDMHGARGTMFRRRLILAEFLAGAVAGTLFGVIVAVSTSSVGWFMFGVWLAGIGLNYVPLALHALSLSPQGRLEDELAGADVDRDLRRYTKEQFWLAVPLFFVILAAARLRAR
jgi:hypothetical protein